MLATGGGGAASGGGRAFPGLGFDPAEGDAGAVQALTTQLAVAIQATTVTLPRLQSATTVTDDGDWGGGAAEEFSDHGDDLPVALDTGMTAMSSVAQALTAWYWVLLANQSTADALEREAVRLKRELAVARAAEDAAAAALVSDTTHPEYEARMARHREAAGRLAGIAGELARVIDAAQRLKRRHERAAERTAEAIRQGADGEPFRPENDGFLVQLSDGIAKAGDTVSMVTGTLAAGLAVAAPITGGASLVPAAVLGTASAGAGVVGAVGHLGQQLTGSRHAQGFLPVLLSLGTSAVPGGRLAVTGARKGAKAMLTGQKVTARELDDALRSGGLPKIREDLRDIRDGTVREAVERDLRETGEKAARRLGVDPADLHPDRLHELGLAAKAASGVADLAGHVHSGLEQAGVVLSDADRNALRAIKLGLDPTDARTGAILEEVAKDEAGKGRD